MDVLPFQRVETLPSQPVALADPEVRLLAEEMRQFATQFTDAMRTGA